MSFFDPLHGITLYSIIKNDLSGAIDDSFIKIGNQRILFPITVDSENEDLIEIGITIDDNINETYNSNSFENELIST